MNNDFLEKANQLGIKYIDMREKNQRIDDDIIDKKNLQIEKLESQLEELPEQSPSKKAFKQQIEKLQSELNTFEEDIQKFEKVRKELLEITKTSFSILPENDLPNEQYFNAITDILLGKQKEKLEFEKIEISAEGLNINEEDEAEKLILLGDITIFIKEASKQSLGESSVLTELLNRIKTTIKNDLYEIFVKNDELLTVEDINAFINDSEWDIGRINDVITDLLRDNLFDHKIIRRIGKKGAYQQYQISDVGRILNYLFPVDDQ